MSRFEEYRLRLLEELHLSRVNYEKSIAPILRELAYIESIKEPRKLVIHYPETGPAIIAEVSDQ